MHSTQEFIVKFKGVKAAQLGTYLSSYITKISSREAVSIIALNTVFMRSFKPLRILRAFYLKREEFTQFNKHANLGGKLKHNNHKNSYVYLNYYGLSDNPFSIAPNPDYLFMSTRHKQALAHLTFGLNESGGFVMLTGEVGTGKTTVSRKLMQDLGDETQMAVILNPTLSALELLATVCDELGISYQADVASLKTFTDKILNKLANNHEQGINTVLLIDEAQHLLPEVLEQLRLLTNLETNREKLLKVVLIGQPELQQLLRRNELRQLAQRVTARYHLLPLTQVEVAQYVEHRWSVAGGMSSCFTKKAIAELFTT